MRKLTAKQKKFADEYLIDLNGTQAAIRAGYSVKSAARFAIELLHKTHVAEYINKIKTERSERTKIDADYVLNRIVEIDQMDVLDILDGTGNFKSITEWPKAWRTTISGLDIQEIMQGDTETVMRKIKWPDKVKNLELLGRHVSVQAFKDQKQLSGELSVTNLIKEISAKNAESRKVLPKHR